MPNLNRSLALLVLLGLTGGCTVAKISGRGSIPLMLNTPPERVKVIEHFTLSKMITFDYTNTFDVSEILAEKLQQGNADAITNLTITVKSNVGSFMVNLFTLGLAQAKVFAVRGDLVRIEGGASSLLDAYEVIAIADHVKQLPLLEKADSRTSLLRLDEGFALVQPAL